MKIKKNIIHAIDKINSIQSAISSYELLQLEQEVRLINEVITSEKKTIHLSIIYGDKKILFFENLSFFPLSISAEINQILTDALNEYDNMITEIKNKH